MKKTLVFLLMLSLLPALACGKKNRASSDTLTISVDAATQSVAAGGTLPLRAICRSPKSNDVDVSPTWSVTDNLGTFNPAAGKATTFTAGSTVSTGTIYATYSGIQGALAIAVGGAAPPPPPPPDGTVAFYSDAGLHADAGHEPDIIAWAGPGGYTLEEISGGGAAPDPSKFERDTSDAPWFGWGITLDKNDNTYTKDMSAFSSGHIKFYIKTSRAFVGTEKVFINVQEANVGGAAGPKSPNLSLSAYFDSSNPAWQEVSIPLSAITGVNLSRILNPILLGTADMVDPMTIDVDYIRWTED